MIRWFNRWLRVVLPHWPIVLFVIVFAQMIVSLVQWYQFGDPWKRPFLFPPLIGMVGVAMVVYSHYRVLAFHPLWREEYFNWLKETPWRRGQPLPIGPVHLVLQDVFIVAVAFGLSWWWGDGIPLPWLQIIPSLFLGGYLLTSGFTLWQCGLWGFAYLVGFWLGLCVFFFRDWGPFWMSAAITYGLAQFGLIRSWEQFPWSVEKLHRYLKRSTKALQGEAMTSADALGWPFEALSPEPGPQRFIERHDAWLLSLLVGWAMFAVATHVQKREEAAVGGILMLSTYFVLMPLVIARLVSYFKGIDSPLDLHGRLLKLRWIIPGFDVAILPFLLTGGWFVFGVGMTFSVKVIRVALPWWDNAVACGLSLTITLLLLLVPGPPLRRWRLTGNMRLKPWQGGLQSLQNAQQRGQYVQCH